jgi:hypothetical protein
MTRFGKVFLPAFLAGAILLGLGPPAEAGMLRLRVEDTTANVGAVLTDTLDTGVISFSGTVGAIDFTVVVGATSTDGLTLSIGSASSTTGGTLRVTVEAIDYTFGSNGTLPIGARVTGTFGDPLSSATVNAWVNPANSAPSLGSDAGDEFTAVSLAGNPIGTVPTVGSTSAFGSSQTFTGTPISGAATFTKSGNYALFAQATVNLAPLDSLVDFELGVQVLPAPGGLVLALAALPGFGMVWLRRRLRKV